MFPPDGHPGLKVTEKTAYRVDFPFHCSDTDDRWGSSRPREADGLEIVPGETAGNLVFAAKLGQGVEGLEFVRGETAGHLVSAAFRARQRGEEPICFVPSDAVCSVTDVPEVIQRSCDVDEIDSDAEVNSVEAYRAEFCDGDSVDELARLFDGDAFDVLSAKKAAMLVRAHRSTVARDESLQRAVARSPVTKPPVGSVMVKQLFAGQLGLTHFWVRFLAWQCGKPLDLSFGWGAGSRRGVTALRDDFAREGPYRMVIASPCGPWSKWSQLSISKGGEAQETLEAVRAHARPLLRLVNKTVADRVSEGHRVLLERPADSRSKLHMCLRLPHGRSHHIASLAGTTKYNCIRRTGSCVHWACVIVAGVLAPHFWHAFGGRQHEFEVKTSHRTPLRQSEVATSKVKFRLARIGPQGRPAMLNDRGWQIRRPTRSQQTRDGQGGAPSPPSNITDVRFCVLFPGICHCAVIERMAATTD